MNQSNHLNIRNDAINETIERIERCSFMSHHDNNYHYFDELFTILSELYDKGKESDL